MDFDLTILLNRFIQVVAKVIRDLGIFGLRPSTHPLPAPGDGDRQGEEGEGQVFRVL